MLASRKELLEYDLQQREAATKSSRSSSSHQPTFTASQYRALSVLGCGHTSSTKCYGCASAVTGHCITLLRALATNPALRQILVLQGLIRELFEYNLRRGTAAMREEVRQLICLLTRWVSPPSPYSVCLFIRQKHCTGGDNNKYFVHFFLFQRSSRGDSTDERPHYCQGVSCPEGPLGQS